MRTDPCRDAARHLRVQRVELAHAELPQAPPPRHPDVDRCEAQHPEDGMGLAPTRPFGDARFQLGAIIPQSARYAIRRSSR